MKLPWLIRLIIVLFSIGSFLMPVEASAAIGMTRYRSSLSKAANPTTSWKQFSSIPATGGDVLWFSCWNQTGSSHTLSAPKWNGSAMTTVGTSAVFGTTFAYMYYFVATSTIASSTMEVTTSANNDTVTCMNWQASGEDTTAIHDGAASTTVLATTISLSQTPSQCSDLMLSFVWNNDAGASITKNAGLDNIFAGYNIVAAATGDNASTTMAKSVAYTETFNLAGSNQTAAMFSVLLKSATATCPNTFNFGRFFPF